MYDLNQFMPHCLAHLCHCGSSCSLCSVPLQSHLTLWPPAPRLESVPGHCDLMTAHCLVCLEGNIRSYVTITPKSLNFLSVLWEFSSLYVHRSKRLSTYVWFLQCGLCVSANSTHCCCDWMISEHPPLKEKGKGCQALVPKKNTIINYHDKTSWKLFSDKVYFVNNICQEITETSVW